MSETLLYAKRMGGRKLNQDGQPTVKVIGVGAAGTNIIGSLFAKNLHAELISINTDWKQISAQRADKKLLIGISETRGLGSGGDPLRGKKAAMESLNEIKEMVDETDLLILIGGLGNGTATGAMPVIAEQAAKKGATVVSFAVIPFFMNKSDIENTESALTELEVHSGTTIVLDQNRLLEVYRNLPLTDSFVMMNTLINDTLSALIAMIRENELMEVNFSHLREVFDSGGFGTLGISEVENYGNLNFLVQKALEHKLFHFESKNAQKAVVQVIGDQSLSLQNVNDIAAQMKGYIDPDAELLVGAKINHSPKGKIETVVILTGLEPASLNIKKEITDVSKKF